MARSLRARALALAALALDLLAAPRGAAAGVIAVGRLQTCVNSGGDAALACARKIVVTLSLENDKLYQTEQLEFDLACVTTDGSPPPACPCTCSYFTDPSCACRDLRRAVRVAVTKSPVFAAYPLAQPRTLNGRAHEEYITTGPGGTVGGACRDGDHDAGPTCGWAKAPASAGGGDVPDSQGLCCSCPAAGGGAIARGNRACAWSPSWLVGGVPGSAHCMRYDEYWWYRGYSVGAPQLEFDVQVHVSADGAGAAPAPGEEAPPPEVLTVSPSRTTALSADRGVAARLLGDLAAYASAPAIEGHWLLVPLPPGLPPNEAHSSNLDTWMVLPPALVATAGECDRVGVGYSAFRHQANACARPVGSCLGRQVFDLEREDAARAAAGLEPLYNITRYGGGRRNARQIAAAAAGGGLSLRLPVPGVRTSLVTLEVRADNVALVVNRAHAKILAAEVCTFDFASCGAFQAIATRGFLRVRVGNVGAVAADFRAGVVGCSAGVLPVAEEFGAIAAGGEREFRFALAMESDVGGNRTCTVVVSDAVGDLADSAPVGFHAAATEYMPPPEQSDLGDKVCAGLALTPIDTCTNMPANLTPNPPPHTALEPGRPAGEPLLRAPLPEPLQLQVPPHARVLAADAPRDRDARAARRRRGRAVARAAPRLGRTRGRLPTLPAALAAARPARAARQEAAAARRLRGRRRRRRGRRRRRRGRGAGAKKVAAVAAAARAGAPEPAHRRAPRRRRARAAGRGSSVGSNRHAAAAGAAAALLRPARARARAAGAARLCRRAQLQHGLLQPGVGRRQRRRWRERRGGGRGDQRWRRGPACADGLAKAAAAAERRRDRVSWKAERECDKFDRLEEIVRGKQHDSTFTI
jgi:hypothetical protein